MKIAIILLITFSQFGCTVKKVNKYYQKDDDLAYYVDKQKKVIYRKSKVKIIASWYPYSNHNKRRDIFIFVSKNLKGVYISPTNPEEVIISITNILNSDKSSKDVLNDSTILFNTIYRTIMLYNISNSSQF